MILSDNETKLDLLNNEAIAKTIVSIIKDSEEAISVGVHGDWGAGKSSVLAMVESILCPDDKRVPYIEEWDENDEEGWSEGGEFDTTKQGENDQGIADFTFAVVRFNSWQYQGFEDSKIALMSAIVAQLENYSRAYYKKHKIKGGLKRLKNIGRKLWDNLDKLGLVKTAGKLGVSLATGTVPLAATDIIFEKIRNVVTDDKKASDLIETIGDLFGSKASEISKYKEMEEFRRNFEELFSEAHIDKMVVIIDDLDRCLPAVAIDTLEAIRLFMFLDETAFVIGADEMMIRYSVKKHFPDLEMESKLNTGSDFADKYLEKLIQVPFRIPALGSVESQLYTLLLLIGTKLNVDKNDGYKALILEAKNKLSKPWNITPFNPTLISEKLGKEEYKMVQDEVFIGLQISSILYDYSRGNPRVIKRFINMLILRYEVARNRGYGDDVDLRILAKMMLAERQWPQLYVNIARNLSDGKSPEIASFEDFYENADEESCEGEKKDVIIASKEEKSVDEKSTKPDIDWINSDEYKDWLRMKPSLKDVDLRPYYIASKEKRDFFSGSDTDEALHEMLSILMSDDFVLAEHEEEIKGLSEEVSLKLFEVITSNIEYGDFVEEPKGFKGLKKLAELHPALTVNLVDQVVALPAEKVDLWIASGWEKIIPKESPERNKLNNYINQILEKGKPHVQKALKVSRA